MTSYIIYSFNSFIDLETITTTTFSNGFLLIANSSIIMNNSIFNNYGSNQQEPSELSVFCFPEGTSSTIILIEKTLFLGVTNNGNGSVNMF